MNEQQDLLTIVFTARVLMSIIIVRHIWSKIVNWTLFLKQVSLWIFFGGVAALLISKVGLFLFVGVMCAFLFSLAVEVEQSDLKTKM